MKKFFAAMILIFVISSVSYGAEIKDGDYIRKEVFDARMDRMEALLEKTVYEIKIENEKFRAENEKFRSEIKADIQNLASDVKVLETRVTELDKRMDTRFGEMDTRFGEMDKRLEEFDKRLTTTSHIVYWIFAISSVILAVLALSPIVEKFRKPSINLTDVEQLVKRLIEENNAKLAKQNPSLIP